MHIYTREISISNTCSSPNKSYTSAESKRARFKRVSQGLFALCSSEEEVYVQICGGNKGTHDSLFAVPAIRNLTTVEGQRIVEADCSPC